MFGMGLGYGGVRMRDGLRWCQASVARLESQFKSKRNSGIVCSDGLRIGYKEGSRE